MTPDSEEMLVHKHMNVVVLVGYVTEVQAKLIDHMECLDAISYLFNILKEVKTSNDIMNSLFAIQVIGMNSEIKCSQVNYIVLEEQGCFV